MEPILNLSPAQFRAALAELNLPHERDAELRRLYRLQNSPFAGLYGLLSRVGEDAEGMDRATLLPVSRPEGMSVADAIRSGEAELAAPRGLLDAIGSVARAVDAPSASLAGLLPSEDVLGEALNIAGMAQLGGAAMPAPHGALRSGALRVADDVAETPAQTVARMLREGRASEVTDDLMAQVDPQEMYRLYEAGETGMPMPMDEASRMARAEEMGFDTGTPLYHGATEDFPEFSLENTQIAEPSFYGEGVYSTALPNYASVYSRGLFRDAAPNPNVMPLTVRRGNELTWPSQNHFQTREAATIASQGLRSQGVDTIRVPASAIGESPFGASPLQADNFEVVSLDPRNIRSRFARFDPRLSHLANLNSANIDPLTGAAAMGASQQSGDPLASLRAYLAANSGLLSR